MKRVLTGVAFLSLAAFAHLAAAAIGLMEHAEGTEATGDGGDVQLTLQASNMAFAAMVEAWETPVAPPLDAPIRPITPVTPDAPSMPNVRPPDPVLAPQVKALPLPVEQLEVPEQFVAPQPPKTPPSPKPAASPKAEPAKVPQQAREGGDHSSKATRAAGSGGGQQAGQAQKAQAAGLSTSARQSALSKWQSTIRARIERRKRAPRGAGEGVVTLVISIANTGALQQVRVSKSSGSTALDTAAMDAVKRASFPAAPQGLTEPSYQFQLPMRFEN